MDAGAGTKAQTLTQRAVVQVQPGNLTGSSFAINTDRAELHHQHATAASEHATAATELQQSCTTRAELGAVDDTATSSARLASIRLSSSASTLQQLQQSMQQLQQSCNRAAPSSASTQCSGRALDLDRGTVGTPFLETPVPVETVVQKIVTKEVPAERGVCMEVEQETRVTKEARVPADADAERGVVQGRGTEVIRLRL
jgi:hypothetical protein